MEFSMRDMGEDVVRMMERMDIPSAIIVGHSMGGYIALSILKNFPERIIGIALIASHIYADSESKKKQRIIMAEQLTTEEPGDVFYDMPGKLSRDRAISDLCKDMIKQTDAAGKRRFESNGPPIFIQGIMEVEYHTLNDCYREGR
jgi:pimeloyl-ACP methyl ester carboxylesterase